MRLVCCAPPTSFRVIRSCRYIIHTRTCPIGMKELTPWGIHSLVGVGPEVVALGLQEVCRQAGAAVAVEEVKGGGHSGDGNAHFGGPGDNSAPGGLGVVDEAVKIVVQQKV